jgi:DNA-binding NtrC family response regulator
MAQAVSAARHAILIVEDEAFIRYDLFDFFEDQGFDVFEAENADVAIELMAANPTIRVVLTDVDMPGSMDGVRLAHFIRERYPPTLLLIASGAAKLTPGDMPVGALFVAKPFDPRSLLGVIREASLPS